MRWSRVSEARAIGEKGDEKSPEVSTIIEDGSVCDLHKVNKN